MKIQGETNQRVCIGWLILLQRNFSLAKFPVLIFIFFSLWIPLLWFQVSLYRGSNHWFVIKGRTATPSQPKPGTWPLTCSPCCQDKHPGRPRHGSVVWTKSPLNIGRVLCCSFLSQMSLLFPVFQTPSSVLIFSSPPLLNNPVPPYSFSLSHIFSQSCIFPCCFDSLLVAPVTPLYSCLLPNALLCINKRQRNPMLLKARTGEKKKHSLVPVIENRIPAHSMTHVLLSNF